MAIVSVGIDLAKNVFAVHGVDDSGKPALVRPSVPRAKLLELIGSSGVIDDSINPPQTCRSHRTGMKPPA